MGKLQVSIMRRIQDQSHYRTPVNSKNYLINRKVCILSNIHGSWSSWDNGIVL